MLYKIYYELENGYVEFFAMFSNDIDADSELINNQVALRQGKFLKHEWVHI